MDNKTDIDVQYVSPLKKICMTIGELPSSYLETMSYYEMLVWFTEYLKNTVIPTINNNAEAVDELQSLYEELRTYVNDYFDNLDVQEEINNKLNTMTEDGTLTAIIKNYVDPIYQAYESSINETVSEQSEEINTFKQTINGQMNTLSNKVDAVESGTPIAVSSVDDMTDTDKIYVNTTDGNWYFYDSDSWEIGGTYQATEIANGSVTYNDLASQLKSEMEFKTDITTIQPVKDKIIGTDGSEISLSSQSYFEIDVEPFSSYKLHIYFPTSVFGTTYVRTMFKNNNTVISYTTSSSVTITDNTYDEVVEIPYNVNKLIVNAGGYGKTSVNYILKINSYAQNNISKNQLDSKLKTFFKDTFTEVTPTSFISGAFFNAGYNFSTYAGTSVVSLEVEPGDILKVSGKQIYTNPLLIYTTQNNNSTVTVGGNDYVIPAKLKTIVNQTSGYQFENEQITIPECCTKLLINKWDNDSTFKIEKATSYKVDINDVDIENQNPLDEKTLCFAGDSITAASTTGVKGWVGIMAENNPNATFYNYGHDGYTIAKAEDEWSVNSVQNVLPTMLSEHPTTNYIVIQGGVNDYYGSSHGITLGDISTGYSPDNLDRSTFSGGLEYIFYYLYTNFPNAKIAYIVTHKVYASNFYQFMDRAKEICKKWSIPYIDLFDEGNINFFLSSMRYEFSLHTESAPNGDGLHPNLAGYQKETPLIENALKYRI